MRYFYAPSLLALGLSYSAHAQQPFLKYGVKVKVATLSNGRFQEFFTNDSLRRIGSVVYNTRLHRVAYLLPPDSLIGHAKPDITSRWISPDPLAEKDMYITPYAFCRDNAILYSDPDGREVVVPDKKERATVARYINERAAGTFAFNSKGQLYLKKAGGEGSNYYTSRLQSAIKDKDKITVDIADKVKINGKMSTVASHGDGVTLQSEIQHTKTDSQTGKTTTTTEKPSSVYIDGKSNTSISDTNGQPLRDTPADILAHELVGHAIPHSVGPDTGNAVQDENKVRAQQPAGQNQQRQASPSHVE